MLPGELVKLLQIVAGDGGIRVVFGVPLHVPVHKRRKRIQPDGAATESEIVGFWFFPYVHRIVYPQVIPLSSIVTRQ